MNQAGILLKAQDLNDTSRAVLHEVENGKIVQALELARDKMKEQFKELTKAMDDYIGQSTPKAIKPDPVIPDAKQKGNVNIRPK